MNKTPTFTLLISFLCFSLYAGDGIPEPMLFDLVRPLDSKKGELEVNTLVHKSYEAKNTNHSIDPFGSGSTTSDKRKIEWSPEIEYAIDDGFALEFELPIEGSQIEAYKFGAQYTFGKVNDFYIHGIQVLLEPNKNFEKYNTTVLYLGGYRFNEIFSSLFMLGGRMDIEGSNKENSFEYLANGSLFAQFNHTLTLGLETNYSLHENGNYALTLVPQVHYNINKDFEFQAGLSFGNSSFAREKAFVFRGIYAF
ncbi:MAG: hypothetical protein Q8N32_00955 [Sulfuricurvum sp.]|nr:hypothetical protein [Sulfuricurvum sp.]